MALSKHQTVLQCDPWSLFRLLFSSPLCRKHCSFQWNLEPTGITLESHADEMQISDLVLLSYESSKHKTKGSMLLFLTVIHVKFNIKQKFAKFTSEEIAFSLNIWGGHAGHFNLREASTVSASSITLVRAIFCCLTHTKWCTIVNCTENYAWFYFFLIQKLKSVVWKSKPVCILKHNL